MEHWKLGIDAYFLRQSGRGVARVLNNLIKALCELEDRRPVSEIVLFGSTDQDFTRAAPHLATSVEAGLISFARGGSDRTYLGWQQLVLPGLMRRSGTDVLYVHGDHIPMTPSRVVFHVPEDPTVRWRLGDGYSGATAWVSRGIRRALYRRSLEQADRVVVSTTAAARTSPFAELGARVVPLGSDRTVFTASTATGRQSASLERASPYILHLGSGEPRDQSTALVDAYASVSDSGVELPELRVVGSWKMSVSQGREKISFLGRVSDIELANLYRGATAVVQPSLYEGFGLQLVEALACGTPVVIWPDPAACEVAGAAGIIIDCSQARPLEGLFRSWSGLQGLLIAAAEAATPQAAIFSWERSAEALLTVIRSLEKPSAGR